MQYELYQFAKHKQMNLKSTLEIHILFAAQVSGDCKKQSFLILKKKKSLAALFTFHSVYFVSPYFEN